MHEGYCSSYSTGKKPVIQKMLADIPVEYTERVARGQSVVRLVVEFRVAMLPTTFTEYGP